MRFFKMNGIGNDYIFLRSEDVPKRKISTLTKKLCNVHTGIGADGVVIYSPGTETDLVMRIFNRDGSEAEMCGNALRCLIRHWDKPGKTLEVLTKAGVKKGVFDGKHVTIDLSKPVSIDTNNTVLCVDNRKIAGKKVNFGNPHFIIKGRYDDKVAERVSNLVSVFPERTNVEFCSIRDNTIFMRVYERGCGQTLACGTGAAACFVTTGLDSACVRLPGGVLYCEYALNGDVLQTGNARYNYIGEWTDV